MPKGILTQFIVAMHKWILGQKNVWKSGVVLYKDQAKAEVIEHYGKREIQVRVDGKNRKELLTLVNYELDKIHDSYKRLKYAKLIPCSCKTCQSLQESHFYTRPYTELVSYGACSALEPKVVQATGQIQHPIPKTVTP